VPIYKSALSPSEIKVLLLRVQSSNSCLSTQFRRWDDRIDDLYSLTMSMHISPAVMERQSLHESEIRADYTRNCTDRVNMDLRKATPLTGLREIGTLRDMKI
jgi:hypothetical protein